MSERVPHDAAGGAGSAGRSSPLVVVTRRAVPGRRKAFERWIAELETAARRAPGFVGLEISAPDDAHPDDWGVVYRFSTGAALDAWLASPERAQVLESGADIVAGQAREQRLAVAVDVDPVTAVSSVRVRAGEEDAYAQRHAELVAVLTGVPGFLRAELFAPIDGVQDETVTVLSFSTRTDLDAWLDSDVRTAALAALEPLVEGERTVNVVGGFAGWFAGDGTAPVKRWKQALVVLAALYPTALVLGMILRTVTPGLPAPLLTLAGNILGVAFLTWVVMPPLTRLFDAWLRR